MYCVPRCSLHGAGIWILLLRPSFTFLWDRNPTLPLALYGYLPRHLGGGNRLTSSGAERPLPSAPRRRREPFHLLKAAASLHLSHPGPLTSASPSLSARKFMTFLIIPSVSLSPYLFLDWQPATSLTPRRQLLFSSHSGFPILAPFFSSWSWDLSTSTSNCSMGERS
jgi:hypothetical protein